MKTNRSLRRFLAVAASSLLAISCAHAQSTLYWDANAATALQTDGLATWLAANQWWNGATNTTWVSGDSAVFGYSGAGGAVTLSGTTTVGSLVFNPFTGTYTLGTTGAGNAIMLNSGITHNSGGTATIVSPLILGGAQTWTNNSGLNITGAASPGSLVVGSSTAGIDNGGNLLTINGIGTTQTGGVLSGAGGLTKNGTGTLILSGPGTPPLHTYTGTTTINGGVVRINGSTFNNSTGTGNITINSGVLEGYFGGSFTRALGSGAGQIQILGGTSGFSGQGGSNTTFNPGGAGAALVWGSTFFNPTEFVLQSATANANGIMTLTNGIDLGGATRTIASLGGNTTGGATVAGAVTNGGLTKIGVGNLILGNAGNNYSGATTINGGTITLSGSGAITATSALNLGGGTLRLVNTANTQRFADVAVSATAGGGISYENTNTAAITYTESLGAVTVSSGLLNVVQNANQSTSNGQTLTLGTSGSANLTQSGTGSVAFSALTTGPQTTGNKNMFMVFGAGTTAAGQIVGPWATVGTAANVQTDYAAYNADYVVPAAIAGSAETTWTAAADPYTMDFSSAGTTLTSTRNIEALRIIGGTPLTSVDFGPAETITLTGHAFVDGNTVVFGSGAPGGLTAGTTYFVVSAAVDTFKVSAALAGAAINLTSAGTSPTVVPSMAPTLALSTGSNLGTNGILNGSPHAISITPGTGGAVTLPTITFNSSATRTLDASNGSGLLKFTSPLTSGGLSTGGLALTGTGAGEIAAGMPFLFGNLTKSGNGTWTVGGAMGNIGTTTISAGTLIFNSTKSGAGAVAVNGTSTLGGSGNIAGVVTVAAGANLSPGASVGTLTFRNDLNISALAGAANAGLLNYELGPIASSDKIVVAGTLNIGTALLRLSDFNFTFPGVLQNGTYKLITSGAAVSGTLDTIPANLTGAVGGGMGTLQISGGGTGNDIELVVTGIGGASAYDTWKAANAPGSNPDDDTDGDGVSNAVEFVLGGTSATNDIGKLPTVSTSGGNLVFSFKRKQSSIDPGKTTVMIELSTDLVTWTNPPSPYAVSDVPVAGPPVAVVDNLDGTDTVTLTVLQDVAKKFARLRVVITP